MSYNIGNPNPNATGLEIVIGNFETMSATIEDVKYPQILWNTIVRPQAIDTGIDPGSRVASYTVRDMRGKGAFRSTFTDGTPTVGQSVRKEVVNLEASGIASVFDRQDIRGFQKGDNPTLFSDVANIMRFASERHIEETFFYGFPELQYSSWLDFPGVPVAVAALNAAATSTEWVNKTPDEILFDINDALATVWENSLQVHLPGRVLLPPIKFSLLVNEKVSNAGNLSILEYVKTNNIYTAQTGVPLEIVPIRYLTESGPANVDVMRIDTEMVDTSNIYWFPMPMPFQLLAPQESDFAVKTLGEYIFGAFDIKWPGSQISITGI